MTLPIRVWLAPAGPNPWKVVVCLNELEVPYEIEDIRFQDIKETRYTNINPNGRVPAIEDPNTGDVLWETGAIIQHLIHEYDKEARLSYDPVKDRKLWNLCNQWLFFQVSGHGPYIGQAGWFRHLHPEKLPSAIERYDQEARRVLGVIEQGLSRNDGSDWLVGDRITFADLSFLPWNDRLDVTLGVPRNEVFKGFPRVEAWQNRMAARPSWIKAMETRAKIMDKHGLDVSGRPKGGQSYQQYHSDIAAEHKAKEKAAVAATTDQ